MENSKHTIRSPNIRSPFQADVSPLPGPVDPQQQEESLPHDEPTFQLDPQDNVQYATEPVDPFAAIRDFVKKPKVSVKEVHQIMRKHQMYEGQPKSRQASIPSQAYQKAMSTV